MKVCSITGIPFYDNKEIMVIPVIIRDKKVMQCYAEDNVHPLPIAFNAEFGVEDFYPVEDERFEKALRMISSLVGKKTTWDDFEMFGSNNKKIKYGNNHKYSFGLFLCHKYAFDNIMNNYKAHSVFNKSPESFPEYNESLKSYIYNSYEFKMKEEITYRQLKFVECIPSTLAWNYALPDDFNESDLDTYAEIRMLSHFLNVTGKQWIDSVNAPPYEKPELAMNILLDSINVVSVPK